MVSDEDITPFDEDYDKYDDYNYDRIYSEGTPKFSYKELEEMGYLPKEQKAFDTTQRLIKYHKQLDSLARNIKWNNER